MSKNQELEALYDTVAALYLKNIKFFSTNHKFIHSKIVQFEQIGKENYFIEFTNNHFELIDSKDNPTYNCDPFFDAQKRCENLSQQSSLRLISNEIFENKVNYKNSINAYDFLNDYIKSKEFKDNENNFDKFIFIGTLLGVHLNDIDKKIDSNTYLIIEDNIEIFRLSFFLTDYESLAQNSKLFFCLNENIEIKENIVKEFLSYKYEFNNYIGFELASESSIHNLDFLTKFCVNNDSLNYPFSEYLVSLKRGYNYYKTTTNGILKLSNKVDILNKPILFLGAGPSLAQYIEWVYMNQDNFLVVCAASTLKRCELLDIVPDIILSADGQNRQVLRHFDVNEKYFKNSIIITSIKTDEEVIEKIESENLFFIQDSLELFSDHGIYTGLTVGDTGLKALLNLGASEIYILGFDAAISKSGKTHDGMYKSSKVKMEKSDVLKNEGFNTSKDLVAVKGNFEKEVLTFMLYVQMIESINEITASLSSYIKIYNLSHGAYFNNCIPLKIEEFDMSEFMNINKEEENAFIYENLQKLCKKNLSSKDIQEIKLEQKIIKKLININQKNLNKEFNKLKSSYKNSIVIQIIEQFFKLIKPYSQYTNKQELEYRQFKEVLTSLDKTYKIIN